MVSLAVLAFLGMLCIGLVLFVPTLLRTRIRVLRWLGLSGLAGFHERHFEGMVLFGRIMLAVVGMVMLLLAVNGT